MKITLLNEKVRSWNDFYAGKHWSLRSAEATRIHYVVRHELNKMKAQMLNSPVDITVTGYYKGRAIDADNLCSKFYIDGLKGLVIPDDSPKYVNSVKTMSKQDKINPRVEIEVEEIK